MSVNTYGRWPWVAATTALPVWIVAARGRRWLLADGRWVAGLTVPILLSHQTEEWVRPGGFLAFCNQQVLGSDKPDWPLTRRDAFHLNVSLGWGSAILGSLLWGWTPLPAAAVLGLEIGNTALHGGLALHHRRYNPGVVTAALLMGPHALAALRSMQRGGRMSSRDVAAAAALSLGITGLPLLMKRRMRRPTRTTE